MSATGVTRRSNRRRIPAAAARRDPDLCIPPASAPACRSSRCRFSIGRHADNSLVLRDNRASRSHARIVAENGAYVWRISTAATAPGSTASASRATSLRNSDPHRIRRARILSADFHARIRWRDYPHARPDHRQLRPRKTSKTNLTKLRSLVEVARALQNSLSTQEVLTAVVDAALAVTGCERGFLHASQGSRSSKSPWRAIMPDKLSTRTTCACPAA